ncbi:MAG: hypothetical protein JWM32_2636 [Verrucomicrobia bacterium]|nr:hypothetical protein [Verrucomicrobiota bacterium]
MIFRTSTLRIAGFFLAACASVFAAPKGISVRWAGSGPSGEITVLRGTLVSAKAVDGTTPTLSSFQFPPRRGARLDLVVDPAADAALPSVVTIGSRPRPFSFKLSDVTSAYPIYLPADGVIVTTIDDARGFDDIAAAIQARHSRTKLQQIAAEPEESFAQAETRTRETKVETWLGLGRDDRVFRVDPHLEWIQPRLSGRELRLPETENEQVTYEFLFGRGWGVRDEIKRHLDNDVLPILRATIRDESVQYDVTLFSALERQPLVAENIRGTPYLLANLDSHGHQFTAAQAAEVERVKKIEEFPDEETVVYARVVATNRGAVPQYAFLKAPTPTSKKPPEWSFDGSAGFGLYKTGRVYAVAKFNGRPLAAVESSPLLLPGKTAVLEFYVPHRPLTRERALVLNAQSFDTRLTETRTYWERKLAVGAAWQLPEPRIDAMVRAGLLHLDLVFYGREPAGPLLPAIGVYTAIGSESSPIIQFMDSMGWHDTAARALDYFFAKQHDDGFMQNFNGYMLETGAVLWTAGEHYRYTHDDAWLKRVHPHLTLACEYLEAWRRRNLQPELKGDGYGMLDGKTADPEDPYRSFMLNGYAYLGLSRAAEMLAELAPDEAAKWRASAATLKADIRASLEGSLARAPVVPLGDGTWSRAAAPWTLYRGPVMLHTDGGRWFTHGAMTARDSLLGPLYLVFQEVVDPGEPIATELLQVHSELMTTDNVAFSQPYYSRHPWLHLKRGEPKPFLKAWYNTVSAMADRETFTFTEHLFPVSSHKTHEEAWFLMETRWMLYLEEGSTLRLLSGVPRAYLEPGKHVTVKNASSYFGSLSFQVESSAQGELRATIDCPGARHPRFVEIRLPHPNGKRPVSVSGGAYDSDREVVRISDFNGHAEVALRFK